MNVIQKNKKTLLYLGIAIFTLFVVSAYLIYPFSLVNGDGPPPLPSGETITMSYYPTLQSIPSPDTDGTLYLSWNSIENALAYQVYYKKSSGNWISKITLSTTYVLRFLGEGDFSIMVRGYNNIGYSNWSPIKYVTVEFPEDEPPPDPPDAPTLNLVILATNTDDQLYLNWNAITGAVSYQIYMSKDGGAFDPIKTTTNIFYTTDELTDGNYDFKVKTYKDGLYSDDSNVESYVLSIPTAPNKPILDAITPTLSDDGLIRLDWDTVDNANKYYVYRAKNGGEFDPLEEIFIQIYYDDVIEFDGNYSYRVKAGNDVGYSDYSNEQSVVVQLIAIPESPIMNPLTYTTVNGITTIQLSWSEVDCDSYNVYRKIDTGNYILIEENLISTSYSEALTDAGVYFYRVSATNICGESEMSDFTSIGIIEDREPIVRGEEPEEPPIEPTDYTMLYVLIVVLVVLAVPVLILMKRKKR